MSVRRTGGTKGTNSQGPKMWRGPRKLLSIIIFKIIITPNQDSAGTDSNVSQLIAHLQLATCEKISAKQQRKHKSKGKYLKCVP